MSNAVVIPWREAADTVRFRPSRERRRRISGRRGSRSKTRRKIPVGVPVRESRTMAPRSELPPPARERTRSVNRVFTHPVWPSYAIRRAGRSSTASSNVSFVGSPCGRREA
jgi:hypothetical protein